MGYGYTSLPIKIEQKEKIDKYFLDLKIRGKVKTYNDFIEIILNKLEDL